MGGTTQLTGHLDGVERGRNLFSLIFSSRVGAFVAAALGYQTPGFSSLDSDLRILRAGAVLLNLQFLTGDCIISLSCCSEASTFLN